MPYPSPGHSLGDSAVGAAQYVDTRLNAVMPVVAGNSRAQAHTGKRVHIAHLPLSYSLHIAAIYVFPLTR